MIPATVRLKSLRVVIVAVIALQTASCSPGLQPSGSGDVSTPPASPSTSLATAATPKPTAASTPTPIPTPTPEVRFRALDTPAEYARSGALAVDGTTAVGFVQLGKSSEPEKPAVWETTTGALHVLEVPAEFIHPNGDTFVRLVGISGTTAVGTGTLGKKGQRGQDRAMAWNIDTGELRILDIPSGFTQAEAFDISGTTAVGQVWTADGETGRRVAWDTETGAVRILKLPGASDCGKPGRDQR